MAHARRLCLQVVLRVGIRADDNRDAILHNDIEGAQSLDLSRIVRHELNTVDAAILQDVWHTRVLTRIALEAELRVGIDGVDSVLL